MKDFYHSNIELQYLYRDAGNYKLYECAVFDNPDRLSPHTVDTEIRKALIDGEFFDPNHWGIYKPRFDSFISELDHSFCEYVQVVSTNKEPTIDHTISDFLNMIT